MQPATHSRVRLTVPAREALQRAGALIVQIEDESHEHRLYQVTPGESMPTGIVASRIVGTTLLGLRLDNEPPYPGEVEGDCWAQLDFTPCPICGASLVWYEAGYVPGYRVCARAPHHHILAR